MEHCLPTPARCMSPVCLFLDSSLWPCPFFLSVTPQLNILYFYFTVFLRKCRLQGGQGFCLTHCGSPVPIIQQRTDWEQVAQICLSHLSLERAVLILCHTGCQGRAGEVQPSSSAAVLLSHGQAQPHSPAERLMGVGLLVPQTRSALWSSCCPWPEVSILTAFLVSWVIILEKGMRVWGGVFLALVGSSCMYLWKALSGHSIKSGSKRTE